VQGVGPCPPPRLIAGNESTAASAAVLPARPTAPATAAPATVQVKVETERLIDRKLDRRGGRGHRPRSSATGKAGSGQITKINAAGAGKVLAEQGQFNAGGEHGGAGVMSNCGCQPETFSGTVCHACNSSPRASGRFKKGTCAARLMQPVDRDAGQSNHAQTRIQPARAANTGQAPQQGDNHRGQDKGCPKQRHPAGPRPTKRRTRQGAGDRGIPSTGRQQGGKHGPVGTVNRIGGPIGGAKPAAGTSPDKLTGPPAARISAQPDGALIARFSVAYCDSAESQFGNASLAPGRARHRFGISSALPVSINWSKPSGSPPGRNGGGTSSWSWAAQIGAASDTMNA